MLPWLVAMFINKWNQLLRSNGMFSFLYFQNIFVWDLVEGMKLLKLWGHIEWDNFITVSSFLFSFAQHCIHTLKTTVKRLQHYHLSIPSFSKAIQCSRLIQNCCWPTGPLTWKSSWPKSKVTGQIWHFKKGKLFAVSCSWQSLKSLSVLQIVVTILWKLSYFAGQVVQLLLKGAGPPQNLLASGHQTTRAWAKIDKGKNGQEIIIPKFSHK